MQILRISLVGATCIMFVLLLRMLLLYKLPKIVFVYLSDIVLLQLLFPFTIPSPFGKSSYGFAQEGNIVRAYFFEHKAVLTVIWLVVALTLFFLAVLIHSNVQRQCSHIAQVTGNATIHAWKMGIQGRRRVAVKQWSKADCAFTYGVMFPVIVLPIGADLTDANALRHTLAHEYAHIRRFDVVRKWGMLVALCLHWFNPCVWLFYVFANRNLELACDEYVLQSLSKSDAASYARLLVNTESTRTNVLALVNHQSGAALEERIISIMRKKKITTRIAVFSGVLLVLLAVFVGITLLKPTAEPVHLQSNTGVQASLGDTSEDETTDEPSYATDDMQRSAESDSYHVAYIES